MKKKKNLSPFHLSPVDVEAIICALPLVANAEAVDPNQSHINRLSCNSAMEKLLSKHNAFSANELRVMYCAIGFALDIIGGIDSGVISVADVDAEHKNALSKNFLIYNRLYPFFNSLISRIERDLD